MCDPLSQKGYLTKSLGRSPDKMETNSPWVIWSIYCFWFLHTVGHLFYHIHTAHSPFRPVNDFKNTFQMASLLLLKPWKSFQLHFLAMATLLPSYFKRLYNFTLAQFWNFCQIKALCWHFLLVSITGNDQTDAFCYPFLSERVTFYNNFHERHKHIPDFVLQLTFFFF